MNPSELAARLRKLPVFDALDEPEALQLAERARALRFAPGMRLFAEGELADGVFIIVSGSVEISCAVDDGTHVVVGREGAGALMGELALVDPALRSATCTAVEETLAFHIDAPAFTALVVAGHPGASTVLHLVARQVCRRLRGAEALLDQIVGHRPSAELRGELRNHRGLFV